MEEMNSLFHNKPDRSVLHPHMIYRAGLAVSSPLGTTFGRHHTDINTTIALQDLAKSLSDNQFVIANASLYLQELLWQPKTFICNLVTLAWTIILTAPPLVHLLIIYLMVRHVLYKWVIWAVRDYQDYLDLGRGGSPSDLWGWWRVTRLRIMAAIDVLEPPHVPPMLDPYRGLLWDIPIRQGPRPIVRGIAPQRQTDQKTPVSTFDTLMQMITSFADMHPALLRTEKSFLEGHTTALRFNSDGITGIPNTKGEFGFEICHPHRNDGSMHLILHPEDVKTVLEAGWGERHPLATNRWYWKLWYHGIRQKRLPVSEYLVLVYAPRNQEEIQVIYRLIRAAVWFATKEIVDADIPKLLR